MGGLPGAFLQPSAVICDTNCLKTLPPEVFADGAAEALAAARADAAFDGVAVAFGTLYAIADLAKALSDK